MRARLGDTLEFTYSAPDIHDKKPRIFFLARVGKLIHGLNQHYQTPTEKIYYYFTLKKLFYGPASKGITPQDFYAQYVKKRMITDAYRTYKAINISAVEKIPMSLWGPVSQKIDIRSQKTKAFSKGQKVKFVSMNKGKLSWTKGIVLGRKVPGLLYVVELTDGSRVTRHPSDLRDNK